MNVRRAPFLGIFLFKNWPQTHPNQYFFPASRFPQGALCKTKMTELLRKLKSASFQGSSSEKSRNSSKN
jgi:hypothetical protein